MAGTAYLLTSGSLWTVPGGIYPMLYKVECWGAGGDGYPGGAGDSDVGGKGGNGGGGGAYSAIDHYDITARTTIDYHIGLGDGDFTWFNLTTTVRAESGHNATSGAVGAGGSATNGYGTIKRSGKPGSGGAAQNDSSEDGSGGGGGAGSAGPTADGGFGSPGTAGYSGNPGPGGRGGDGDGT